MPIRPENRDRYPDNWPEIRASILERDGHRCAWCGRPDHVRIWVSALPHDGRWAMRRRGTDPIRSAWRDERGEPCNPPIEWRSISVIITVAHLNHTPEDCTPSNLVALCQRCHLAYDAKHHREMRRKNAADPRQKELEL